MMERKPEVVDDKLLSTNHDVLKRIRHHYRMRPMRWHFASWLIVGLTLGFLIAPDVRPLTLLAFMISGCVCCTLLALLTYPFSGHSRLTLIGAGTGLLLSPLCSWIITPEQANINAGQLGLIMGALTGATSLVWLGPIRIFRSVLLRAIVSPTVQQEQSARL